MITLFQKYFLGISSNEHRVVPASVKPQLSQAEREREAREWSNEQYKNEQYKRKREARQWRAEQFIHNYYENRIVPADNTSDQDPYHSKYGI